MNTTQGNNQGIHKSTTKPQKQNQIIPNKKAKKINLCFFYLYST